MEIINGKEIATKLEKEVYEESCKLKKIGIVPTLSLIVIKGDKKSEFYVKRKKEACERVGIKGIIKESPGSLPLCKSKCFTNSNS